MRKRLIASAGAVTGTAIAASALAAVPASAVPQQPARPAVQQERARAYAPGEQAAVSRKAARSARVVTVRSGDTLWGLAKKYLGSGDKWGRLYAANRQVIGADPNLIVSGERLQLSATASFGGNAPVAVPARAQVSHHVPAVAITGTVTAGSMAQLASLLTSMGYDGQGLAAVAQFLRAHGYTAAGAAGVDACVAGESAGNPESVGSGGFGLIGWTGNVIGLPFGYAGPTGSRAADLAAQETGILGYNAAVGDVAALNAQAGPAAAASYYSDNFERPRVPGSDIRAVVGTAVFAALGR